MVMIGFTVMLSWASTGVCVGKEKPVRPNILFIYTDDHSYRTVNSYPEAYDWVRTPNIDSLARRGVQFSYAYIGTWCMASRASLLTGHQPYGVESMRMEGEYPGSTYDPGQSPFWPKVFRENGYVTAQIGKWHTGTDTGFGRDWDHQIVWNRPAYPENSRNYYYDQLITINGGETKLVKGYSTDNYTRWALDFIRERHRNPGKPWYLWLCYGAVHGPFTPADRHLKAYSEAKVPIPADIYPPRPGKPEYMQHVEQWIKGEDGQPVGNGSNCNGRPLESAVQQYHEGVLAIDEGVGRIMKLLKETNQLRNTLVVFTSDQGFAWGQHGFCKKLAPYDATIRSPLIVSMPGTIPQGVVCETAVGGVDLVPTFFRFAGIKLPWKMHGNDLTSLLQNPKSNWDHSVLVALTGMKYGSETDRVPTNPKDLYMGSVPGRVPWWISLRQGRYKYIRTLIEGEIEELYDLELDPEELRNLALEQKSAGMLRKFRKATIIELRRTDAGMADHLPAVKELFY